MKTSTDVRFWWLIVALLCAAETVGAQESSGSPQQLQADRGPGIQTRYYMCVFAYQTEPRRPRFSKARPAIRRGSQRPGGRAFESLDHSARSSASMGQ